MNDHSGEGSDRENLSLSRQQLQAFEQGWAATIMPVREGWKIHYFSTTDFEGQPGTVFPTFDEAVSAVTEVLPAVNSLEERERARRELSSPPE